MGYRLHQFEWGGGGYLGQLTSDFDNESKFKVTQKILSRTNLASN